MQFLSIKTSQKLNQTSNFVSWVLLQPQQTFSFRTLHDVDQIVVSVIFPPLFFVLDEIIKRPDAQGEINDENQSENIQSDDFRLCRFYVAFISKVDTGRDGAERKSQNQNWQENVRQNCKRFFLK